MNGQALFRPVALGRGDVLHIRDGRGVTVRPTSGVLWVTEEQRRDDRVVTPGFACRIEGEGLALVVASRAARVELEVPAGHDRRPEVRLLPGGRDASRPVRFRMRRGVLDKVADFLRMAWRRWRHRRERAAAPRGPVGGSYEHDRFLSSRRPRGSAGGSLPIPFDGAPSQRFLTYY